MREQTVLKFTEQKFEAVQENKLLQIKRDDLEKLFSFPTLCKYVFVQPVKYLEMC